MHDCFDIVLSANFSIAELTQALRALLPDDISIVVTDGYNNMPGPEIDIWCAVHPTEAPSWPISLTFFLADPVFAQSEYSDMRIAFELTRHLPTACLTDIYPFAGDFNPNDPFWLFGLWDGSWHLVSSCGCKLMGPYDNGKTTFPGSDYLSITSTLNPPLACFAPLTRVSPSNSG